MNKEMVDSRMRVRAERHIKMERLKEHQSNGKIAGFSQCQLSCKPGLGFLGSRGEVVKETEDMKGDFGGDNRTVLFSDCNGG